MGVSTASNATFSTMATNISNIKTGIDFDAVMPYVGYEEVKLSSLNDTIPSLNKYVLNRLKAKSVILLSGFATKSAISAYLGFADNSNLQMMTTSTGSNKIYGSFDNKLANSMYIGACAMEITPMTTNYSIVGQNVDFTNYYTNYVSCLRFIVPDAQEITLLYGNYIYGSYQIVTTTIPDDGYRYRIIKLYAEQRYNPNTDSSYQPYELKFDMSQSTFGKNSVQPITKRVEYFGGSHTYKTWARVETIENLNAGDIIKVRGANDGGEVILLVKSYEKY